MANVDQARERALALVTEIRSQNISDERLGEALYELKSVIPYPTWSNLIFRHEPRLSNEDVVEEALRYRPIEL